MANMVTAISNLMRGVVSIGILALVTVGGWIGYKAYDEHFTLDRQLREKDTELRKQGERIKDLGEQVAQRDRRIQKLDLAMRLLKTDHRLAEMRVVEQYKQENQLRTKFEFVEVNDEGRPLDKQAKVIDIAGDVVYIDAWVVKFRDSFIEEANDPLRATSLCLFRRIYSEQQEPVEGTPIDPVGSRPTAYARGSKMSEFESTIWEHFWDYANNRAMADAAGIRANHGEAVSIRLQKGKLYKIRLRSSDGLSITAEEAPSDKRPL